MVAAARPEPPSAPLADEHAARLLTADRVPLTVPLAGLGERAIAYGIDLGILLAVALAGLFLYNLRGDIEADLVSLSAAGRILLVFGVLALLLSWDALFEVFADGRTPGKRLVKLRVVGADGRTPDALRAVIRNGLRLIDWLPFLYGVGTVTLFFTGTRRLGDLLADTFVVSERERARDPFAACRAAAGELTIPRPAWSDDDAAYALDRVGRTADLAAPAANKLAARALARVDPALAEDTPPARARVVLAAGCLALADAPTGRLAQIARLVAAERALGEALARLAASPSLDTADDTDDALRHAGSELMRATRRGVAARALEPLSLALLDAERRRAGDTTERRGLFTVLAREVPAAIYTERAQVGRAAATFVAALVIGFGLCVADGALGRALIGDSFASAIEGGANWMDRIETERSFALAAAQIIFNNAWVCLVAFVSGLLGGVLPLVVLFLNGLHLGSFFGYATQVGTAQNLLRFVLAHGPVELTAVCVAGAAGMCLGRALLAPGRRTRLEALRAEAGIGARMLVGALFAIGVIGTVEGFVSPGQFFPWPVSLALGLALWALFFAWVRGLGRAAAEAARRRVEERAEVPA